MKQIPNLFTLLNLFFGCLAIIFMLENSVAIFTYSDGSQYVEMPPQIWMASLCIGLAAVIDFVDGFVARLFRSTSEMGKQLDSLADLVSFGVAPGIILFEFLKRSYAQQDNGMEVSVIWLAPALILPCAAAWRLAKFNLDNTQSFSFKGLPTPAVGLFIASLPLVYYNYSADWQVYMLRNKWVLYGIILLFSFLMVSNLPLMSLKFKDFSIKNNLPKYLLAVISIASIFIFQWLAVPVIVLAYVLISLLFKNKAA